MIYFIRNNRDIMKQDANQIVWQLNKTTGQWFRSALGFDAINDHPYKKDKIITKSEMQLLILNQKMEAHLNE